MRVTVKTKSDLKPFRKLIRQVNRNTVKVGYINSDTHWMNEKEGLTVADVAAIQHFDGAWGKDGFGGSFMLDDSKRAQVLAIVKEAHQFFGTADIKDILAYIGDDAVKAIAYNIYTANTPSNADSWAERKGFDNPLVYGSATGEEPNLTSDLSYKVGHNRD